MAASKWRPRHDGRISAFREAREPEKIRYFEEVKDQIAGYLFQEKSAARFRDWMEEVKKAAYISIK